MDKDKLTVKQFITILEEMPEDLPVEFYGFNDSVLYEYDTIQVYEYYDTKERVVDIGLIKKYD